MDNTSISNIPLKVQVANEDSGMRLDLWLAKACGISRNKAQKAIMEGRVISHSQSTIIAKYPVQADEEYSVYLQPEPTTHIVAQLMKLDIIFEDDDVIVLNKPVGLVVHPGAGNRDKTLINGLLAHAEQNDSALSEIGGQQRPGIVHRLDKDTSGLLVVAKNDATHLGLQQQFQERTIARCYHALVWGRPKLSSGKVDLGIMRHPRHPQKMITTSGPKGRQSLTNYKVIQILQEDGRDIASLVECYLETGRTHQIRVHMTQIGHPLIGDPLYGRKRQAGKSLLKQLLISFQRQALHAKTLGFIHPKTKEDMFFESPLANDFADLFQQAVEISDKQ